VALASGARNLATPLHRGARNIVTPLPKSTVSRAQVPHHKAEGITTQMSVLQTLVLDSGFLEWTKQYNLK
jgi:hypothetical protein